MTTNDFLNEEKFQKAKKVLVAIGSVSIIIGIGLLISSFMVKVPEMGQEGWFEARKLQSTLRFSAFPFILMIPLATFTLAFRREIMAFSAQQMIPIAQEGVEKMAPTAGKVAKELAKGVVTGINEAKRNQKNCKYCSALIDEDSVYCEACGKKL